MDNNIVDEILTFYEALTRAQLSVIKQFRKRLGLKEIETPREKRMSQMDMIYDILTKSQSPMHVDDIIAVARATFDIKLDKESVVSALAKRIKRHDRFIKTAPNTYALIDQEWEGGHK
jgi:DNA-directed RNA polymerase delta subunit